MKCIWLIIVVLTTVGLDVLARPDVNEIVESATTIVEQNDESPADDTAKSSDPDTFDDETSMNDLEKRLPSGYETVRDNVVDSEFDCKERTSGFYADTENDCQIFHRCSEDQVYSFYCPEGTVFSQKQLVCIWNGTRDFECSDSENYYEESNRAFFGNFTAMENIRENMKISAEIPPINIKKADVEVIKTEIHDAETSKSSSESSEMLEKNSIEENVSETNEDLSVADSGDYHSDAEFLPHVLSGPDASIASSESNSELDNVKSPQKIAVSVLDPIIEMPSIEEVDEQTRNHQKRSNNIHRRRFLFKADTTN